MKRLLLGFAALVVVVSYAWVLGSALQNRRDARGGTAQLTERELRIVPMPAESTVTLLELRWGVRGAPPSHPRAVPWLDATKLAGLGFDCRVPFTSPEAKQHYRTQVPVEAFVVLELETGTGEANAPTPEKSGRLKAIDAGRDPVRLRGRYQDPARHLLTRAVLSLSYTEPHDLDRSPRELSGVQAWIDTLLPSQIYVPPPHSRLLTALRSQAVSDSEEPTGAPRFTATIDWGTDYLPYLSEIRLLGATSVRQQAAPPQGGP